ncbi:MAG: CPBP family intramembrane metalloprotease [candidate division KSB1 bacterium]|nr:CPBP family intramembrane metalloprotease [candidate division KSB1 bacterium]MDZ7367537.1 CPBP family intramembrane metalloprotease [candidate division KSB1 bacterium]MDZ7404905.1 CPBP family intramembrane metalloprotease [candidate division KSB1 bacterium]
MAGNVAQKLMPQALDTYFKKTRSHFFGLLTILLLLLIYEGSSAKLYADRQVQIRNSAEVIIERFLWFLGVRNNIFLWAVYLLVLVWAFWLAKKQQLLDFKFVYIPYSIFESTFYALSLGLIAGQLTERTNNILTIAWQNQQQSAEVGERAIRALGAGIYEELLFRFVLISLLLLIFEKLVGASKMVQTIFAVIISALLFSGFHYLGGREVLTPESFAYRFYAGVILGVLFIVRGIGVTSYTHSIYNLLLVFR